MSLILEEDPDFERMKKNGPQETTYASLFWAEDIPRIRKLFLQNRGEEFNLICRGFYEDQTIDSDIKIRPVKVAKTEDIPTYPGLGYCMQLILGTQTTRYKYAVVGTDNSQARPYQQGLYAEVTPRVDVTLPGNGSIVTALGSAATITFTGIFPASFPTAAINESTFSTASPGGIYLNRNMFSANPINHTVGVSGFTIQSIFSFKGTAIWE